jgi:hypothetical protein
MEARQMAKMKNLAALVAITARTTVRKNRDLRNGEVAYDRGQISESKIEKKLTRLPKDFVIPFDEQKGLLIESDEEIGVIPEDLKIGLMIALPAGFIEATSRRR